MLLLLLPVHSSLVKKKKVWRHDVFDGWRMRKGVRGGVVVGLRNLV